jgi:DNA-binding response OmpR family regulator
MSPDYKAKILLVEDDPDQVLMYKTKFELEGFKIITATEPEEALRKAREEKPDLILLDVLLYEHDGLEVLEKLKSDLQTKQIPVLILSNLKKRELEEKAQKLGALAWLVKIHYLPKDIVAIVRHWLKKTGKVDLQN